MVSLPVRIIYTIASCVIVLLLYSRYQVPPQFKPAMDSCSLNCFYFFRKFLVDINCYITGELAYGVVPMWTLDLGKPVRTSLENSVNYGIHGPVADAQWEAIIPDNGGIVYMGRDRRPFMPSMFHQLQCLKSIRISYLQVNSTAGQAADPTAQHCLNYLRQMILCRGDLNLEQVISNHFHSVHFRREQTCRNWEIPYAEHAHNHAEYLN